MSLGLKKMDYQDPLEEINLETEKNRKPTYVSKMLDARLQETNVLRIKKDGLPRSFGRN